MRVAFLPVLMLLLSVAALAEVRVCTAAPNQGQSAQGDEGVDPDVLFPLAKRNGLQMSAVVTAVPELGKGVTNTQFVATFKGGKKALKNILAHPENATGVQLAVASYTTYRSGDLAEAAFLYYACRLRFFQDLDKYVPKEKESGLSSTNWFLSLLVDSVKADLLRDLYLQPEVLASVVKRIETFELREPAGYDPGWDYTLHAVPADLFAKNKAMVLENLKPTSDLLLVPEYSEAFRTLRECNDASLEQQKGRAVAERRSKAIEAMRRIEKEKKLHGVIFQLDQNPSD
jgi:hypothetical protein